jgi:hypothetical protein
MNLYEELKKEREAVIQATMNDEFECEADRMDTVLSIQSQYRKLIADAALMTSWNISPEDWKKTPKAVKKAMRQTAQIAEQQQTIMDWVQACPV